MCRIIIDSKRGMFEINDPISVKMCKALRLASHSLRAIYKNRKGESGNVMRRMIGMRRIMVGMRGIMVWMWGIRVGMQGMGMGMWEMRGMIGMLQNGLGLRGIRVGNQGIGVEKTKVRVREYFVMAYSRKLIFNCYIIIITFIHIMNLVFYVIFRLK